jgi:predicted transcriptional regulator
MSVPAHVEVAPAGGRAYPEAETQVQRPAAGPREKGDLLRPDLYVVMRFLERMFQKAIPLSRTRLQVAIGVNYTVFSRYLRWLSERGLVERVEGGGRDQFRISRKGYDAYRALVTLAR